MLLRLCRVALRCAAVPWCGVTPAQVQEEVRSLQYHDLHYLQQDAEAYLIRDVEARVQALPGHLRPPIRQQHIGQVCVLVCVVGIDVDRMYVC